MSCTSYNYTEIKTDIKGIVKRVPMRKNMSKASKNVLSRFHKVRSDLKPLWNGFHEWNIVFNVQICIE